MFDHLQIQDQRERYIVGLADALLAVLTAPGRLIRPHRHERDPQRVLLLRLERIGDLVMTLGAIAFVRQAAPEAEIDLVVGSWNEPLARCIPGIQRVESLDASWLSRNGGGLRLGTLASRARRWRTRQYDLAINFEADIRSHLLLAVAGARRRVGFDMAGGGPLLTDVVAFNPREHVSVNALRLVARAFPEKAAEPASAQSPRLHVPEHARHRASELLAGAPGPSTALRAGAPHGRPLVGLHPSGGRAIKQWHADRFAQVARALRDERGASIVLTGSSEDRDLIEDVKRQAGEPVIDLGGRTDLLTLTAVLERLDLLITGDTGPMHLASAVGTPVVALFGPSDPARWGPAARMKLLSKGGSHEERERGRHAGARPPRVTILRVDLPCSPCNRVRQPPSRCLGHVPDCLDRIQTADVTAAAIGLLDRGRL